MKKIEFGYANEKNPKGSWEGIGIKPGLLLTEADYYGAFKYEDNTYIVAKVVKDEYEKYPELVGNFIVRQAIADLYPDGSGILYLDQEQSLFAKKIESYLNTPEIKSQINKSSDLLKVNSDLHSPDRAIIFLTVGDTVLTTSISHDAFERKNDAIKGCHSSFSELSEEQLSNGYSK